MIDWTTVFSLSEKFLFEQVLAYNIPPPDLEEMRQNVFLRILKYQKSLTALSPEGLATFIDKAVGRYSKRWQRYRNRFLPMEEPQMPTVNETHQGEWNEQDFAALKLDMAAIMQSFTPEQHEVCEMLLVQSLRRGRETGGITRHGLENELKKIRDRFCQAGYGKS